MHLPVSQLSQSSLGAERGQGQIGQDQIPPRPLYRGGQLVGRLDHQRLWFVAARLQGLLDPYNFRLAFLDMYISQALQRGGFHHHASLSIIMLTAACGFQRSQLWPLCIGYLAVCSFGDTLICLPVTIGLIWSNGIGPARIFG